MKNSSEMTRRGFVKKSALATGAALFLSQGVALANSYSGTDYSNLGCVDGYWTHSWGTTEYKDGTGRTYVKCERNGCTSTSVVG